MPKFTVSKSMEIINAVEFEFELDILNLDENRQLFLRAHGAKQFLTDAYTSRCPKGSSHEERLEAMRDAAKSLFSSHYAVKRTATGFSYRCLIKKTKSPLEKAIDHLRKVATELGNAEALLESTLTDLKKVKASKAVMDVIKSTHAPLIEHWEKEVENAQHTVDNLHK